MPHRIPTEKDNPDQAASQLVHSLFHVSEGTLELAPELKQDSNIREMRWVSLNALPRRLGEPDRQAHDVRLRISSMCSR